MKEKIENHPFMGIKTLTGLKGRNPFLTNVKEEVGEVVDELVGTGGDEVGRGAVAVGDTAGAGAGIAAHEDVDGHVAYH